MSASRGIRFLPLGLVMVSCAGSPAGPEGTVVAVVFYDENGNGRREASETVGVPGVDVEVGGDVGRSEVLTGRAVITGVPPGTYRIQVRSATLPPFFAPSAPGPTVTVPEASEILLPLTLPIGANRPHTYMAFGDSITDGDGSSDDNGYRSRLHSLLLAYFGKAELVNEAESGTTSDRGADRIGDSLGRVETAYTLILYGTNDWNEGECMDEFPCFTLDSLRSIVRSVRAAQSLPFLATIIPANPARPRQAPPERNEWVARMNDLLRPMAAAEGAVLVDLYAAFLREGDITQLFVDHVHPNDRGYDIIAREFFGAITKPPQSPSPAPGLGTYETLRLPLAPPWSVQP